MAQPITTHAAAEAQFDRGGRASWGAIFAGGVVALATFLALTLLGLGIGVVDVDPRAADPVETSLIGTGVFIFVSQLVALGVGGFVAGRLAGVLHTLGSALHGATVWGLTTLAAAWLATSAATGLLNLAGSAVSTALSGASSAAQAVIPDDLSLPDISASAVGFDDLPEGIRSTLRENGITPENFQTEAREAFREVISRSEQARAREAATSTVQDIVTSPGDIGEDISGFTDRLFGQGGILSEEDRQEALQVMETRFGISPEEAESYIDQVQASAERAQQQAEQAIETARQEALQAAEEAAQAVQTAGILGFIASMIGLAAAVGGAVAGRVKFRPDY